MKHLKPLGAKVIVSVDEKDEKSPGGILLPDTAKEKPCRGRVQEVGPGRLLDTGARAEMTVKPGDAVLFSKYGGTEVKLNGEDYLVIDEDQIYAVIDEKEGDE